MRTRRAVFLALLILACAPASADAQGARQILVLGDAGYLDDQAVARALGAVVIHNAGTVQLREVSALVLANIALGSLPDHIRAGLIPYVNSGGALLITGGKLSFGSGGYQAVAPILPFAIRSTDDWRAIPFRPPVPLQPGHPILAGVEFTTIGYVNDMNPLAGATEIVQAAGGGGAGSYPYPLIAEREAGGRVIGMAFDPTGLAGAMPTLPRLIQNTLQYLLGGSRGY
jgi:hypothetical protein